VTIKTIMWNYNGIIRTVKRMERAKADLEYLKHRIEKFCQQSEIGNRIITLRDSEQAVLLIVEAALRNRVSRGAHFIKADEN
jgi:L-aspartate oxidase